MACMLIDHSAKPLLLDALCQCCWRRPHDRYSRESHLSLDKQIKVSEAVFCGSVRDLCHRVDSKKVLLEAQRLCQEFKLADISSYAVATIKFMAQRPPHQKKTGGIVLVLDEHSVGYRHPDEVKDNDPTNVDWVANATLYRHRSISDVRALLNITWPLGGFTSELYSWLGTDYVYEPGQFEKVVKQKLNL
jgi:hypothetical protein